MKVYLETAGGLGNQLFMIATALSYAERTHRSVVFLRKWTSGAAQVPRSNHWHTLFMSLPQLESFSNVKMDTVHTDNDPGFRPIPDYNGKSNVLIQGYYQSPHYFDLAKIVDRLFPPAIRSYANRLLPPITSLAFMHIRRGDYKHLTYFHNILPVSYYEQASGHFADHVHFLIFVEEEDVAAVRKEVHNSPVLSKRLTTFIDTKIPDYLQLLMMANCTAGGITANSSFSAWAAYLHPKHNTIVAPKQWFADTIANRLADLALPHWTRI
jgi:hypothetical protein